MSSIANALGWRIGILDGGGRDRGRGTAERGLSVAALGSLGGGIRSGGARVRSA